MAGDHHGAGGAGHASLGHGGGLARTTIDLDDDLIAEVMRRYGVRTKREAVDLARARRHPAEGVVRRPRHLLVYRVDGGTVVVGRVLHVAMELRRHLEAESWD